MKRFTVRNGHKQVPLMLLCHASLFYVFMSIKYMCVVYILCKWVFNGTASEKNKEEILRQNSILVLILVVRKFSLYIHCVYYNKSLEGVETKIKFLL